MMAPKALLSVRGWFHGRQTTEQPPPTRVPSR